MKIHLLAKTAIMLAIAFPSAYANEADKSDRAVADELNALYQKTSECDNGKPSYYCAGIFLSVESFTHDQPSYVGRDNVGPNYYNSYTYLRSDITPQVGQPIYPGSYTGYILMPIDEAQSTNHYQYKVNRYYPWDGWTNGGGEHVYGKCADQGIVTLSQFLEKYVPANPADFEPGTLDQLQCYTLPDYDGFKLGMMVDKYLFKDHPEIGCYSEGEDDICYNYNEVVIDAWSKKDVPLDRVPIKAIFIVLNGNEVVLGKPDIDSYISAFKMADDYNKATHRYLPVVTLDMKKIKSGSTEIFAPAIRP